MELNYVDKFGRWHDDPCKSGEPSSNNGWIFTAYAHRASLPWFTPYMRDYAMTCLTEMQRHPDRRKSPPMSRDEILGITTLFPSLMVGKVYSGNWWMVAEPPKFKLVRFFKQLVELIKNRKDRNYWWENNLEQMQFITMKIPLTDRAYIIRCAGKEYVGFSYFWYLLIETVDRMLKPSGRSSKAIRELKYCKGNGIAEYFATGHPIRKNMLQKKMVKCL